MARYLEPGESFVPVPSGQVHGMTRAQALAFLGLPPDHKGDVAIERRDQGERADSYKHLGGPHLGGA